MVGQAGAPLVLPSNPADAIAVLHSTPPVAKVSSPHLDWHFVLVVVFWLEFGGADLRSRMGAEAWLKLGCAGPGWSYDRLVLAGKVGA